MQDVPFWQVKCKEPNTPFLFSQAYECCGSGESSARKRMAGKMHYDVLAACVQQFAWPWALMWIQENFDVCKLEWKAATPVRAPQSNIHGQKKEALGATLNLERTQPMACMHAAHCCVAWASFALCW